MIDSTTSEDHVNDSEMALYLDRRLSAEQRDRIEDHLAHCAECREHALAAQNILRGVRRRPRLLAAAGALAAAAVVVIWVGRVESPNGPATAQVRGGVTDNPQLIAYGPIANVRRENLRFVWGSAPGGVSYRLNLTTTDGAQVWSTSGVDTTAILPSSIGVVGETYLWVTDAVLADGGTRSTGLREFTLVP
jgi:hypothetical protein